MYNNRFIIIIHYTKPKMLYNDNSGKKYPTFSKNLFELKIQALLSHATRAYPA